MPARTPRPVQRPYSTLHKSAHPLPGAARAGCNPICEQSASTSRERSRMLSLCGRASHFLGAGRPLGTRCRPAQLS